MNDQGFCVPDIRQQAEEFERVLELLPGFKSATDTEGDDGAGSIRKILLRPCVVFAAGQAGIVHPFDCWMLFEEFGDSQCILRMPRYTQVNRLNALQDQKRIEWRDTCASIA